MSNLGSFRKASYQSQVKRQIITRPNYYKPKSNRPFYKRLYFAIDPILNNIQFYKRPNLEEKHSFFKISKVRCPFQLPVGMDPSFMSYRAVVLDGYCVLYNPHTSR